MHSRSRSCNSPCSRNQSTISQCSLCPPSLGFESRVADAEAATENRIRTGRAAKRLKQHPIDSQLARITKLFDADRHAQVAGRGLISVGSEQAVPPREVEPKVTIGLHHQDRVVHAMHI